VLPVAVTAGEPAGIGGEITLEAWLQRKQFDLPSFFVISDPDHLQRLADRIGLSMPVRRIENPADARGLFDDGLPVLPVGTPFCAEPGKPELADAPGVIAAI